MAIISEEISKETFIKENKKGNSKKNITVNHDRYLEFYLGGETYAVPLLLVREVISVPETTPIPKSPEHFLGIMNLRGDVISIIDMRKKLSIKSTNDKKEDAVIIVDINGIKVGVVVDNISCVLAFMKDEIAEMPLVEGEMNAQYILGVLKKENSLTALLDIGKILDVQDMQVISYQTEATTAAAA